MVTTVIQPELPPPGSWDSHLHVVDPETWPLSRDAPYLPKVANFTDMLTFERSIGISHVVLVSLSGYALNHAPVIDALKNLKGKGRAVVHIDPDTTTDQEMDYLHSLGVRGARLNIVTFNRNPGKEELCQTVQKYADRLTRLNWVLQLYITLDQLAMIADVIMHLSIDVVIDHFGNAQPSVATNIHPGYAALLNLLAKKRIYVKISGAYRLSKCNDWSDMDIIAKEIITTAPTQVVWGSDWPHSGGRERQVAGKVQDYRKVNVPAFVRKCKEWCGRDERIMRMVWIENPKRLWRYEGDDTDLIDQN